MAIPSFVQASTGATDSAGAFTFTGFGSGTAGNVVILQILVDGTGAISWGTLSATNINSIAGTANTWTQIGGAFNIGSPTVAQQVLYIGRRTGSSAPTFTTTANTSGDDVYGVMYEFTNVSTGTTLATVIENGTAGNANNGVGTAASVTDTAVTTLGPDRLALNFVGINDDNAISNFSSAGQQAWTQPVTHYADAGGTDASIGIQAAIPGSICAGVSGGVQSFGNASGSEALAQQFATDGSGLTVAYVTLAALGKSGSPTDDVVVEIQTDSAGLPSGSVVGAAGTIAGSSLSTTRLPVRVDVAATLSASTTYHLVVRRSDAVDAGNFYQLTAVADILTAANWGLETSASGVWSNASTGDINFTLHTAADVSTGCTIDGGTFTQADGTDGWGVVGFALIGTTVVSSGSLLLPNKTRINRRYPTR